MTRRTDEISEDTEARLLERTGESPWYTIQVDESTGVDDKATVLVCARPIFQENVREDIHGVCTSAANQHHGGRTTQVSEGSQSRKAALVLCVSVRTDGVAMVAVGSPVSLLGSKKVTSERESTRCDIHREMLAT